MESAAGKARNLAMHLTNMAERLETFDITHREAEEMVDKIDRARNAVLGHAEPLTVRMQLLTLLEQWSDAARKGEISAEEAAHRVHQSFTVHAPRYVDGLLNKGGEDRFRALREVVDAWVSNHQKWAKTAKLLLPLGLHVRPDSLRRQWAFWKADFSRTKRV